MNYLAQLERDIWNNAQVMAGNDDRQIEEYEDRHPENFDAERRIASLIEFISELAYEGGGTPLGALSLTALEVVDRLSSPVERYIL
jgi:hypothetical protein